MKNFKVKLSSSTIFSDDTNNAFLKWKVFRANNFFPVLFKIEVKSCGTERLENSEEKLTTSIFLTKNDFKLFLVEEEH